MKTTLIVIAVLVLYAVVTTILNRTATLSAKTFDFIDSAQANRRMSETVSVSTWNLGYAGLGKESDFFVDGGTSVFPPSGKIVTKNIAKITELAGRLDTDVQFFQEVAYSSPLSLWRSVAASLEKQSRAKIFLVASRYIIEASALAPEVQTWDRDHH